MEFDFWEIENIDMSSYEEKEVNLGSWKEGDPDDW